MLIFWSNKYSYINGYVTPNITENINAPKMMLFKEINDCFENFFIVNLDWMLDILNTNKDIEIKIIIPINAKR